MMSTAGDLTILLQKADQGDAKATEELYHRVEQDLRRIAAQRKRLSPGARQTTTGLIDDAFWRLVGRDNVQWNPGDRRKFFAYASVKIHDIIVEEIRRAQTARRGGGIAHVTFEEQGEARFEDPQKAVDLLNDLQIVLKRFEQFAPEDAKVFRLRYYFDTTFKEIGEIMEKSEKWAQHSFKRAQAWLQNALKEYRHDT